MFFEAVRFAKDAPLLTAAFAVFFALAAFFSLENLTETPPLWYDEGMYTQNALSIAGEGRSAIQTAPGEFESAWSVSGGFPFLYPIALSYALAGSSVLAGRLVMVLFILSLAAAGGALLYRLWGKEAALAGLALLATFPVLYGNGKTVIGEVPGLLYLVLFLLSLVYIERKRFACPLGVFFGAGVLAGLAAVAKPLFLLLPAAIVLVGLLQVRRIPWRPGWVFAAALGGLLPIVAHLLTHISGTPLSEMFSYYANPYAIEGGAVLATVADNALSFFREAGPAYCALLVAVWGGSVVWRRAKGGTVHLAEYVALAFSLLVLLMYVRTAGWYRYFFTANVLALLFAPASLFALSWRRAGILLVTALVVLQGYQLLFDSWVAEHRNSTNTAALEERFARIPQAASLFFLDVPELVIMGSEHPYYQFLTQAPGRPIGEKGLVRLSRGEAGIVVMRAEQQEKYSLYLERYEGEGAVAGYLFLQKKQ